MKKIGISTLILIVVYATSIGIGFWASRPPTPPSESHNDYTAYTQMLENIEAMTQKPHPSGSQELADVRAYLLSQLDEMGVSYQVLETLVSMDEIVEENSTRQQSKTEGNNSIKKEPSGFITNPDGETIDIRQDYTDNLSGEAVFDENGNVMLYNILVKIDAPSTDNGILFMAHYDSEFGVPGACDDMTGVCSLLEAIRRHAKNDTLQNDLYFLFTDGEELGGMGAKVFVRDNPEYKDNLKLIANLDARGTSGGLIMFETSAGDYEHVRFFQKASSRPLSYSWMPMIYRMMSNGTDLTQFIKTGYTALNFAVAEGAEHYSSPGDNIDNLNHGTAYNFLQTAFELSDYAANNPLPNNQNERDGVYFTLFPGVMILMSDIFSIALAVVVVLGALAMLVLRLRTHSLGWISAIIVIPLILLTAVSSLTLNAASYLFSIPLLCLTFALLFPHKWQIPAASLVGFITLLLYTPLCWLLVIALGTEAMPLIFLAAAIPVSIIAAFFTLNADKKKHAAKN